MKATNEGRGGEQRERGKGRNGDGRGQGGEILEGGRGRKARGWKESHQRGEAPEEEVWVWKTAQEVGGQHHIEGAYVLGDIAGIPLHSEPLRFVNTL